MTNKKPLPMQQDLQNFLKYTIKRCNTIHFSKATDVPAREEVFNQLLAGNQFLSLFDLRNNKFTYVNEAVKQVLSCEREEFSLGLLLRIIPPLELFLMIEYAKIAFELMSSGHDFEVLNQTYQVSFPVIKNGEEKRSRLFRKSRIFELENKIPVSILEIWEDVTFFDNDQYVKWSLFSSTEKDVIKMNKFFYRRWVEKLGIGFTRRELQALIIAENGQPSAEIAGKMKISRYVVEEYFKNMKRKIKQIAQKLNDDMEFTNGINLHIEIPYSLTRQELIRYAHTFGLLPDNILKPYFVNSL